MNNVKFLKGDIFKKGVIFDMKHRRTEVRKIAPIAAVMLLEE